MNPWNGAQGSDSLADQLDAIRGQFESINFTSPEELAAPRRMIDEARALARDSGQLTIVGALNRIALMLEVGECLSAEGPEPFAEVIAFCDMALQRLALGLREGQEQPHADWIIRESDARWADYLSLVDTTTPSPVAKAEDVPRPEVEPAEEPRPAPADGRPALDLGELLRMISAPPSSRVAAREQAPRRESPRHAEASQGPAPIDAAELLRRLSGDSTASTHASEAVDAATDAPDAPESQALPAVVEPEGVPADASEMTNYGPDLDDELRQVFLADAADIFERIEVSVLSLGRPDEEANALRTLVRDLHTLKGAAGAVGITELAGTIHALEDRIAEHDGMIPVPTPLIDLLHVELGRIERQIANIRKVGQPRPESGLPVPGAPETWDAEPTTGEGHSMVPLSLGGGEPDGSIRVPSEKLENLLDLVTELIARRGPWAAHVEKMKEFAATARSCRNQLSSTLDQIGDIIPVRGWSLPPEAKGRASQESQANLARFKGRLAEHVEDLGVLSDAARDEVHPMAEDADTLSQLTLRLWDAIQAIRVVPVRGLFQRLARVARDAAKVEGRQVEVTLLGLDTTLDRSVQERLFEPLLHIVRNAVGHGIETADARVASGKAPIGAIILEARRDGNSLAISIRDDGRGLDHAAIAAKGRRLGLLGHGEVATVERIHSLIFMPGFTTRDDADAISGRGVGMDVVAREVGRLRGEIAIESRPGEGTSVTMSLSSRLWLEQAMIVRIDGQPFALPLEAIEDAVEFDPKDRQGRGAGATIRFQGRRLPLRDAREILGLPRAELDSQKVMVIKVGATDIGVLVDSVDGPKELVIKPLGAMLAGHPMICGTSISSSGELAFILDPVSLCRVAPEPTSEVATTAFEQAAIRRSRALVVDDSISVRLVAARNLRALGLDVDEASDGMEAICKLRAHHYNLVLTDLEMPRMDGFELLEEMEGSGATASTPVIVSSTRSDPATRRRVMEAGACAFFPKPAGQEDLARAVRWLLGAEEVSAAS